MKLLANPTKSEIKDAVRERDGFACVDCGEAHKKGRRAFDVHRVIPGRLGGKYTLENCLTLCRKCHRRRHKHKLIRVSQAVFDNIGRIAAKRGVSPVRCLKGLVNDTALAEGVVPPPAAKKPRGRPRVRDGFRPTTIWLTDRYCDGIQWVLENVPGYPTKASVIIAALEAYFARLEADGEMPTLGAPMTAPKE